MVKYAYNVWCKVSKTVNSGCEQVLANNPFMFKGYFYDEESGFYYLKSRYYNPEICRFISMDDINYLDETSLFFDISLFEFGYDFEFIDLGISFGLNPISISIDFVSLFNYIF